LGDLVEGSIAHVCGCCDNVLLGIDDCLIGWCCDVGGSHFFGGFGGVALGAKGEGDAFGEDLGSKDGCDAAKPYWFVCTLELFEDALDLWVNGAIGALCCEGAEIFCCAEAAGEEDGIKIGCVAIVEWFDLASGDACRFGEDVPRGAVGLAGEVVDGWRVGVWCEAMCCDTSGGERKKE